MCVPLASRRHPTQVMIDHIQAVMRCCKKHLPAPPDVLVNEHLTTAKDAVKKSHNYLASVTVLNAILHKSKLKDEEFADHRQKATASHHTRCAAVRC